MIDWTKPIQRRDKKKARYLDMINNGTFPRICAVTNEDGQEFEHIYTEKGWFNEFYESSDDIINVPEEPKEHTGWINIYPKQDHLPKTITRCGYLFDTKEGADESIIDSSRVACIKVTWKDGEGLE